MFKTQYCEEKTLDTAMVKYLLKHIYGFLWLGGERVSIPVQL